MRWDCCDGACSCMSGFAIPQSGKDVPARRLGCSASVTNARKELAAALTIGADTGARHQAVDACHRRSAKAEQYARAHHVMNRLDRINYQWPFDARTSFEQWDGLLD